MSHIQNKFLVALVVFCNLSIISFGQSSSFSPYSRYGLGDINQRANAHIMGAGGAFIALQPDTLMPILLNQANPAALAHIRLAALDLGIIADRRLFETTNGIIKKRTVNFNYAMLGFPIRKNGGACFGVMPYSTVGYNMESKTDVSGIGTITNQYQGSGGVNKAFIGYGILPFKNAVINYYKAISKTANSEQPILLSKQKLAVNKLLANLSLGATANYLFGTVEQSTRIIFPTVGGQLVYYSIQRQRDIGVNGITGQLGLQTAYTIDSVSYRDTSKVKRSRALLDKVKFSFGYYMALNNTVKLTYDALVFNYVSGSLGSQFPIDTALDEQNQRTSTALPLEQGIGFGFKKGDKLHILLDAAVTNWKNFKLIDPIKEFRNSYRLALGVHYIPERAAAGNGAYFKRIQYRLGGFYNTGILELKNTSIVQMAATAGLGLPVGIGRRSSIVNLGIERGQVGTSNNNLLKENYWRINIGLTFNAFEDRWFRKVKYD